MNAPNIIEQRTQEWFALRLGKVTASRINDVMSELKSGGESATRRNYRAQLVCERLTGKKQDSFTNAAMQWGIDCEPLARAAYEATTGSIVVEAGFIDHPTIAMSGMSPDGFVGVDGLLEIKCPNTATHIEWMMTGCVPTEHINQMLWQMDCADKDWCDFISFDPRMPQDFQIFIVRLVRDEAKIMKLRDSVVKFLIEVDKAVEQLNALRNNLC